MAVNARIFMYSLQRLRLITCGNEQGIESPLW